MSFKNVKLSAATHEEISRNVFAICLSDAFINGDLMKRKVRASIGSQVSSLLAELSNEYCQHKALIIRNLPTGFSVSPTPIDTDHLTKTQTPYTDALLLGLAVNLGTPIGFKSENRGAIIHNICPLKDKAATKSGQGGKEPLGMHSDFAFSDMRPDWLMLLCLRNNDAIPTTLCLVDDIIESLPKETVEILLCDEFLISPPDSSTLKTPIVSSILQKSETGHNSRFNKDKCTAKTERAQVALQEFSNATVAASQNFFLLPGDLLIFDNKAMLHGRRDFTPSYDGSDRWLQRVYCHRSAAEARIISDAAA